MAKRGVRGRDLPLLQMSYDWRETYVKVGFEVFAAITMKTILSWDVVPSIPIGIDLDTD
jgi:hypothetical protein